MSRPPADETAASSPWMSGLASRPSGCGMTRSSIARGWLPDGLPPGVGALMDDIAQQPVASKFQFGVQIARASLFAVLVQHDPQIHGHIWEDFETLLNWPVYVEQ
jgi:hypothetical protein